MRGWIDGWIIGRTGGGGWNNIHLPSAMHAGTALHCCGKELEIVIYTSPRTRTPQFFFPGFLQSVSGGPCKDNMDEVFAGTTKSPTGCHYNNPNGTVSTMILKENLMYFATWREPNEANNKEGGARSHPARPTRQGSRNAR